eukprot:6375356-Ditylum_brightwellii.AAC.1
MRCIQHLGNYMCCYVSPQQTLEFGRSLDEVIHERVTTLTDISWISISAEAKEHLQLPAYFSGCGLRELEDSCYAEYLGVIWQGLPPLLDLCDENDNQVAGQFNVPAIFNILGQISFGTNEP